MKVCVVLLCLLCSWRIEAQDRTYLVTAPRLFRLDAVEAVVLQLFGFSDNVNVYVFVKTSMAPDHVVLAKEVVTLNDENNHQGVAQIRLFPGQVDKSVDHVILHIQSAEINQHMSVPLSRDNGFLFVQTDKPLYTPLQRVKVRAFSLNQELRPANRSVFLTFKDPDHETVDIVEMTDANNGIPSMQNPFKIPIKPKLGIWSIEASYSDDFTTKATADFEVKEYVLPSFSINIEPESTFISYNSFSHFSFKVSAKYLHGAPVANGEAFLQYGYVGGKDPPVVVSSSLTRERLSPTGEVDVIVNMEEVLSKHSGLTDLNSLVGKYLYVGVLVQEMTGGIGQRAEFASVKFVKSPYSLSLVSTSRFLKPGLPYNIQVSVKDHLNKPLSRVRVHLLERLMFRRGRDGETMPCQPDSATSNADGLAVFVCNTPQETLTAELKFVTSDPSLPDASQATLTLRAVTYFSPNQRYLYIDPPALGRRPVVGQYTNVKVYSATPSFLSIRTLNFLVLSKGKVVHFGSQNFVHSSDNSHSVSFMVTEAMVPSIRLLVYYIVGGEGTSELVADSIWLDVAGTCVNGLQTELTYQGQDHRPKDTLHMNIRTNQGGLVALSVVDSGVLTLRPNYKDPISTVLRHIEKSDQGCGGGGGRDNADVFRLAGLTFITNANAQASTADEACTVAIRPKRAVSEECTQKAERFGILKDCCLEALKHSPKGMTCHKFAEQRFEGKHPRCQRVFTICCECVQKSLDNNHRLARGETENDFNDIPILVRSHFPESWLWEVQRSSPGQLTLSRTLPDSLTTWHIRAVGVFNNGMCVADLAQVSVRLPLSVDVPLPYQVVRGEQLELRGSVYNQMDNSVMFCVTLTVGPEVCLLHSQPDDSGAGLRSTSCSWNTLPADGIRPVSFTLMGLEPGEHTLRFSLKTKLGVQDVLQKTLRVVPEGVKKVEMTGGRLDPQGLYGSEKRVVQLKTVLPSNVVPHAPVQRQLTINGEVLGDVLSVVHNPEGLRKLINLPAGSAEAELGGVLPLIHIYQYLETTGRWDVLGRDIQKNSGDLRQRIREGLISISSFRKGDATYSMWRRRESSTWLTAQVVKTLALADGLVPVDHQSLAESVNWLIHRVQQPNGSFSDPASYRPNRLMAGGADALDQSVYLTSFVLIALHKATRIRDRHLQVQFQQESMTSAADYISQHAPHVKSVHVLAVATYALTLNDPDGITANQLLSRLEGLARQKGNPVVLRYWQEAGVASDWLRPDEASGVTVETTAYVLMTVLLKGRIHYSNPILTWMMQDQYYGQGFHAIQDTVLTLEAVTEYSKVVPRADLDQIINVRFMRVGEARQVQLSRSHPVATPIQVTQNGDITVSTGYGRGVSHVKLKTVFYETTSRPKNCNFDLTVEMIGPDTSNNRSIQDPHLVACAKFRPPPNELLTESGLTVMQIQLPTGVDAFLEDLRPFRDLTKPLISHYELDGNTVVIQTDSVPSEYFLCVGFRVRIGFRVGRTSESLFSVYEPQDKGSICTKPFSYEQQKLQSLCVDGQCQCMTAACAAYRGDVDLSLTAAKRTEETCRPQIKYAFKVSVTSSSAEGDFVSFIATVDEVLKNTDKDLEAVSKGTEVDLVKKTTCSSINIQNQQQYLVMGGGGSEVALGNAFKYRLPLDSDAVVEAWPAHCSSTDCQDYVTQLNDYALDLELFSCPDPS